MRVIVDSSLLIALVSRDMRSELVQRSFSEWIENGTDLHVPSLIWYEVVSGLAQLVWDRAFPVESVRKALRELEDLPLTGHDLEDRARPVEIAIRLHSRKAYDAAYLALAESLRAEFWTLDLKLFRNASGAGFPVRLLGEEPLSL